MTSTVHRVRAPASIGNLGPGFDMLGAAVEGCFDEAEVWLDEGPSKITAQGLDCDLVPLDPHQNATILAAHSLLRRYGIMLNLSVNFYRQIPIAAGLGSSAAASALGALAAAQFIPKTATESELFMSSLAGEEHIAGRHLDNIAPCLKGGVCLVLSNDPAEVISVPVASPLWVALLTPQARISTKSARALLADPTPRAVWVQQMARTSGLVLALATGDHDLLRRALVDGYAEPHRCHLIPSFREMRQAALHHQALAFSISGAGSTVFAVADSESKAGAILAAMVEAIGPGQTSFQLVSRLGAKGAMLVT